MISSSLEIIKKESGSTLLDEGRYFIETIMETNDFLHTAALSHPTIAVIRNTKFEADGISYVEDTGDNNCDSILLVDTRRDALLLEGRSLPHKKYVKNMLRGDGKCNYIASQFLKKAWRKGFHRGSRAAVQNRSFTVWRTQDEVLQNADDYNEYGIVADNFHGWAPLSAGCVTTAGSMSPAAGDWKRAFSWLYDLHEDDTFFDGLILEHEDLEMQTRYRLGSKGEMVQMLQSMLSNRYVIKADGDFGPYTHEVVRAFQKEFKLPSTGIIDPDTFDKIEEVC